MTSAHLCFPMLCLCNSPMYIPHSSSMCIVQSEMLRDTAFYILRHSHAEAFLKEDKLFVMFWGLWFKL